MADDRQSIIITGVSGNLGQRLLPHLQDFRVTGVDLRPPQETYLERFESMDFGSESSVRQLIQLINETSACAVIHLAFVLDPLRTGVLNVDHMWQINVAGTTRVMEAIAVANRYGAAVTRFIFPSSVSVYGPETPGPVKEDHPLGAHTLPYAIHKMEADLVVQGRYESLGHFTTTYMLRPHIFTGASMQNYMVGALRGTPLGITRRAEKMRSQGKRLPLMLPFGQRYLENRLQFVHVDDMARLLAWLLRRSPEGNRLHILNVAGRGEPLTIRRCAEIAHAKIVRFPKSICALLLQKFWDWGISSIPPEALPYLVGSYTMDTARLEQLLGPDYAKVIHHSIEDALADSFQMPDGRNQSSAKQPLSSGVERL
jgi:nucleoside-diphosphate-sugar epimerase